MKELITIQQLLKAPKGKRNSFGNYYYRSAEDILEAVKPLLADQQCFLTLTDEVVRVGDSNYIKAIATLTNSEGVSVTTIGWAREEMEKKGMDSAQMTGCASSYARKYALNGLFAIDDTKDADTDEYANQTSQPAPAQPASKKSDTSDDNKPWWSSLSDDKKQAVLQRALSSGKSANDLREYYKISKADFETIKQTLSK